VVFGVDVPYFKSAQERDMNTHGKVCPMRTQIYEFCRPQAIPKSHNTLYGIACITDPLNKFEH
jgi:hypothetical protein